MLLLLALPLALALVLLVLCPRPGEAGTCGDSLRCWAAALFTLALRTLPLGFEEIGRRESGLGTPPAAEGALIPGSQNEQWYKYVNMEILFAIANINVVQLSLTAHTYATLKYLVWVPKEVAHFARHCHCLHSCSALTPPQSSVCFLPQRWWGATWLHCCRWRSLWPSGSIPHWQSEVAGSSHTPCCRILIRSHDCCHRWVLHSRRTGAL